MTKKQELCEYLENQIEFQNLKGHKRERNEGDKKKYELNYAKGTGLKSGDERTGNRSKERVSGCYYNNCLSSR